MIRKSPEYRQDRGYFDSLIGAETVKALDAAEALADSIQRRYGFSFHLIHASACNFKLNLTTPSYMYDHLFPILLVWMNWKQRELLLLPPSKVLKNCYRTCPLMIWKTCSPTLSPDPQQVV